MFFWCPGAFAENPYIMVTHEGNVKKTKGAYSFYRRVNPANTLFVQT